MEAGSEADQSIHVLLVSYPTQGHINPLLQFGKRLAARRGVRCTLAVTRHVLASTSSGNLPPQPGAVHVAAFSDGCDLRGYDEVGDARAYLARLASAGSESLGELLRVEAASGRPVRAVVYDTLLPWVPRVARCHGVAPCAAFFTHACAVTVAYAHAWAGQLALPVTEAPVEPLPGLPARLGPADLPKDLSDPGADLVYRELMLEQCLALEVADYVLINSFHELQAVEAEYMASRWGAKTVGPTVPSAYLDNRIADDTSYGFHLHTPMAAESKALGSTRGTHTPSWKRPHSDMEPSVGRAGAPCHWVFRDTLRMELEDGGIMCWCSVPIVAMPQWADQPTNAKYIEDVLCVGVRVRSDAEGMVRKQELERCVREVMEGERTKLFKKNATSWSNKAKKAMAERGSSDSNMVEFLTKLQTN
ncbi:unnamed protein product [Urochloa decumbens]|uniref:Glycosyltransferase n=1 Tax=Urochloa decumbens TaxID=240449 RepID=A0ABC8YIL2_9POAL